MLKINCDACLIELDKPGGLLFSPPTESTAHSTWAEGYSKKQHLCSNCYNQISEVIRKSAFEINFQIRKQIKEQSKKK